VVGDAERGALRLRRADADDAAAVAEVYLSSFHTAIPTIRLAHSDDEVRGWIASHLIPQRETWVAEQAGIVVGLMTVHDGWLEQLYLAPDARGQGIGDRLVELAKERQPDGLQLWTFQVNGPARRFYARHGFREVELTDGSGNDEREPDVRLEWRPAS
jgi:GNAT superfamily N-acetyltransferase